MKDVNKIKDISSISDINVSNIQQRTVVKEVKKDEVKPKTDLSFLFSKPSNIEELLLKNEKEYQLKTGKSEAVKIDTSFQDFVKFIVDPFSLATSNLEKIKDTNPEQYKKDKKLFDLFGINTGNPITTNLWSKPFSTPANEILTPPAQFVFNSKPGKKVATTVSETTGNIIPGVIAGIKAISPDTTFKEAFQMAKDAKGDPSNSWLENFGYQLRDSAPQTLIGVLLSTIPLVGVPLGLIYWATLSAASQIEDKGEVYSGSNIGIDVILDSMLGNTLEGLSKTPTKTLKQHLIKTFNVEGGTELTQAVLQQINNIANSKTDLERQQNINKTKEYFASGDFIQEYLIGGISGAGIGGSSYMINRNKLKNAYIKQGLSPENASKIATAQINQAVFKQTESDPDFKAIYKSLDEVKTTLENKEVIKKAEQDMQAIGMSKPQSVETLLAGKDPVITTPQEATMPLESTETPIDVETPVKSGTEALQVKTDTETGTVESPLLEQWVSEWESNLEAEGFKPTDTLAAEMDDVQEKLNQAILEGKHLDSDLSFKDYVMDFLNKEFKTGLDIQAKNMALKPKAKKEAKAEGTLKPKETVSDIKFKKQTDEEYEAEQDKLFWEDRNAGYNFSLRKEDLGDAGIEELEKQGYQLTFDENGELDTISGVDENNVFFDSDGNAYVNNKIIAKGNAMDANFTKITKAYNQTGNPIYASNYDVAKMTKDEQQVQEQKKVVDNWASKKEIPVRKPVAKPLQIETPLQFVEEIIEPELSQRDQDIENFVNEQLGLTGIEQEEQVDPEDAIIEAMQSDKEEKEPPVLSITYMSEEVRDAVELLPAKLSKFIEDAISNVNNAKVALDNFVDEIEGELFQRSQDMTKQADGDNRGKNWGLYNLSYQFKEKIASLLDTKTGQDKVIVQDVLSYLNKYLKDYQALGEARLKDVYNNNFVKGLAYAMKNLTNKNLSKSQIIGTAWNLYQSKEQQSLIPKAKNTLVSFETEKYFNDNKTENELNDNLNDNPNIFLDDNGVHVNINGINMKTINSDIYDALAKISAFNEIIKAYKSDSDAGVVLTTDLVPAIKTLEGGLKARLDYMNSLDKGVYGEEGKRTPEQQARYDLFWKPREVEEYNPKTLKETLELSEQIAIAIPSVANNTLIKAGSKLAKQESNSILINATSKLKQKPGIPLQLSTPETKQIFALPMPSPEAMRMLSSSEQRFTFVKTIRTIVDNLRVFNNQIRVENGLKDKVHLKIVNNLLGAIKALEQSGMASEQEVKLLEDNIANRLNLNQAIAIIDIITGREYHRANYQKLSDNILDMRKKFKKNTGGAWVSAFVSRQDKWFEARNASDLSSNWFSRREYNNEVQRQLASFIKTDIVPAFKEFSKGSGISYKNLQKQVSLDIEAGKTDKYKGTVLEIPIQLYQQAMDDLLTLQNEANIKAGKAIIERHNNYVTHLKDSDITDIDWNKFIDNLEKDRLEPSNPLAMSRKPKGSEPRGFIDAWITTSKVATKYYLYQPMSRMLEDYVKSYEQISKIELDDTIRTTNSVPATTYNMLKHTLDTILGNPTKQQRTVRLLDDKIRSLAPRVKELTGIDLMNQEWFRNLKILESAMSSSKQVLSIIKLAGNIKLATLDIIDGVLKADINVTGYDPISRKAFLVIGGYNTLLDVVSKAIMNTIGKQSAKQELMQSYGALPSKSTLRLSGDDLGFTKTALSRIADTLNVLQDFSEFFKRDLAFSTNYSSLIAQGMSKEEAMKTAAQRANKTMFSFDISTQPLMQMGNPVNALWYQFSGYSIQAWNQALDMGSDMKKEHFFEKLTEFGKAKGLEGQKAYVADFLRRKESAGLAYIFNILLAGLVYSMFRRDDEDEEKGVFEAVRDVSTLVGSGYTTLQAENLLDIIDPSTGNDERNSKLVMTMFPPTKDLIFNPLWKEKNFKNIAAVKNYNLIRDYITDDNDRINVVSGSDKTIKVLSKQETLNEILFGNFSISNQQNDKAWTEYKKEFAKYSKLKGEIQELIKKPNPDWDNMNETIDLYNERLWNKLIEMEANNKITDKRILEKIEQAHTALIIDWSDIGAWQDLWNDEMLGRQ